MAAKKLTHVVKIILGSEEKLVTLKKDLFVLGRDASADVVVPTTAVSRKHLEVRVDAGRVYLRDLSSANGSFLNGVRLEPGSAQIYDETDELQLAGHAVRIEIFPHCEKSVAVEKSKLLRKQPKPVEKSGISISEVDSDQAGLDLEAIKAAANPAPEAKAAPDPLKQQHSELEKKYRELFPETGQKKLPASVQRVLDEVSESDEVIALDNSAPALKVNAKAVPSQDGLAEEIAARLDHERGEAERVVAERMRVQRECDQLHRELRALAENLEASKSQGAALALDHEQLLGAKHALQDEIRNLKLEVQAQQNAWNEERQTHEQALTAVARRMTAAEDNLKSLLLEGGELKEHNRFLQDEKMRFERERDQAATELGAQKAEIEAFQGECNVRRIKLQVQLEELELKRATAQKEVQLLVLQRKELEQDLERIQKKSDREIGEALATSKAEMERLKALGVKATEEESMARLALGKLQNDQLECEKVIETTTQKLKALLDEVTQVERQKTGLDDEVRLVRDAAAADAAKLRQNAEKEAKAYSELQKKKLDAAYAENLKKMEADLAQARIKELTQIERLHEEEQKAAKERLDFQIREIALRTWELVRAQGGLPVEDPHAPAAESQLKTLRALVDDILHGRTRSAVSEEGAARTRHFWKKTAIRVAVPASIALLYFIFPDAPSQARRSVMRSLASSQAEPNAFLQQIQQRSLKYQPVQNREYRRTYSENILFLERYVELKQNEVVQKAWTVALSQFLPKELGLSDRVVVDLVSKEAVMFQELLAIRMPIVELYREQGEARMKEYESTEVAKIITLLQGAENYGKFRQFEQNFYHEQLAKN